MRSIVSGFTPDRELKMKTALLLLGAALLLAVRADNVQLLSAATADFSQRLYQKLAVSEPNAIYSPYSIHSALSMTSLGARGETATELNSVLGLTSLPDASAHQTYHDVILQLNSAKNVTLHTANALFLNHNVAIKDQFKDAAGTDYLATISNIDLAAVGGPEKPINDFVSNKTEGLIRDTVPAGTIDGNTIAVLVNTIFFNGTWLTQFNPRLTEQTSFNKLGGDISQVSMMNDNRLVKIKRDVLRSDVAELPFKGDRFALYIVLPRSNQGITDLEASLAEPGRVNELFEGLSEERVHLSIPKFKVESSFEAKNALQQLGLTRPFSSKADFSGISDLDNILISDIYHKAVIEVKETGTVAAASTAVVIVARSGGPSATFKADHPFVFFLRDKQTGLILFQGKFSG